MGSFTFSKRTRRAWHQARIIVVAMLISVLLHLALILNPSLQLDLASFGSPPPQDDPMTYTDVAVDHDDASTNTVASAPSHPQAASEPNTPPQSTATTESAQTSTAAATDDQQQPDDTEALPHHDAETVTGNNDHVEVNNTQAPASKSREEERTSIRRTLPAQVTLSYDLYKGDEGMKIGRASHHWRAEGNLYQLSTEAEATGMLALLNLGVFSQQSRGKLTTQGLMPEHYREIRGENRRHHYIAEFDYANNTLQQGQADAPNKIELIPGTHDQLSFIYQLAMQAPLPASVTLPITTGRRFAPYTIVVLGEKQLRTPLGELNTLHLSRQKRQAKDEAIDIWLAVDYHYLPVKIVMTDRKGDTYSQLIRNISQQE